MKFRKKPVTIEAMRLPPVWDIDGRLEFEEWLVPKADAVGRKCRYSGEDLIIPTLEGDHLALAGDWIICGIKGELYPCKPDIFAATYEQVEGAS